MSFASLGQAIGLASAGYSLYKQLFGDDDAPDPYSDSISQSGTAYVRQAYAVNPVYASKHEEGFRNLGEREQRKNLGYDVSHPDSNKAQPNSLQTIQERILP